ncbi:1,4-dihydroxy-2-naphthoate polyprenyltransferase [Vagococcus lutrae]|uniref:1,4-dihydroxy-2-naphthoate polyprenyltransferase n=1 Tax=Vagococcus lutrae TaxID=81947 RepID=UPI00200FC1AA|nr:1,4-dihydroxy-2-naphthoate polyprenyltransferase [Vagococcus lutrae]UQF22582.1 1,4-dihydroxy-2-naphthoate polyprenyltransferase [Vagococcus lutrae]UQF63499.1 1,4-dihydroxy-2-naphthoate polyprenyltransferase [Vagococcus lutrae]
MTVKVFLKLVEIQTKLASLFPFLIGVLFSMVYFHSFHPMNTLIFFIGMLLFDMATTAINNFMDYKKAKDDVYKYQVNIVGQAGLRDKQVRCLIYSMIGIAFVIGLILTYQTGWLMLVMGGVACFIGIFYTFGPVPLSRMPLGEIFSGVTMGFGIFIMTIYINTYQQRFVYLDLHDWQFTVFGDFRQLIPIAWASLPMIFSIANIMLANNLCDLEEDIQNHRYTLPYYIGKENGVRLFNFLAYSPYLTILVGIFFGVYHWIVLGVWLTFPLTRKLTQQFNQKQIKSETFVVSIKNLVLLNTAQVITLAFSLWLV